MDNKAGDLKQMKMFFESPNCVNNLFSKYHSAPVNKLTLDFHFLTFYEAQIKFVLAVQFFFLK